VDAINTWGGRAIAVAALIAIATTGVFGDLFAAIPGFDSIPLPELPLPTVTPPNPPQEGIGSGIIVYYYGGWSSSIRDRLINTPPEFVVLNTPAGAYKPSTPSEADIDALQAVGIKVLSYIPLGNLIHYQYAEDSPSNTRTFVRSCIAAVAAEGCYGVWFDEGGMGNWRDDRYSGSFMDVTMQAPAIDMYGDANTWSGYTMADPIEYAQGLGLYVITGNGSSDSRWCFQNGIDAVDQYFIRETGPSPAPVATGMEVGNVGKCSVLSSGYTSLSQAIAYTRGALANGFRSAGACYNYGSMPNWYESYVAGVRAP
jgi:hypothetical protein